MARVKRVLILVENLPVPNDRRVWLEATTLRDAGYRVSVISITGHNAHAWREVREGIHLYRYPAPPATSGVLSFVLEFGYCWLMTFLLSFVVAWQQGFDVIHACNPPETFWLIGRFYQLFGRKFLFDHHDLSPEMYFSRFGRRGLLYRLLLWLEWLSFRTADVVITPNETHKQIATGRGQCPADRVFVVRSGPDHQRLCPDVPDLTLKNGRRYLITYLGVINPQDGVTAVLYLAHYLINHLGRKDIRFVIMGSGDAVPTLRALCRRLALEQDVTFTGWVEQDTIRRYLATADVCIDTMPQSPYSHAATMNKILEYMAVGRPVVAYDLVETRVSAGEAAILARADDVIDMAQKVLALLEDEERRVCMGRAGRLRIEQELGWVHQRTRLLQAYAALEGA